MGLHMNVIWRFFVDGNQHWKWQQIGAGQSVVAESAKGYTNYEACMEDARDQGYVFTASKGRRPPGR